MYRPLPFQQLKARLPQPYLPHCWGAHVRLVVITTQLPVHEGNQGQLGGGGGLAGQTAGPQTNQGPQRPQDQPVS